MKQVVPRSWSWRILGAIVVLLLVAAGARVVYELLAPLVPWLLVAGLLTLVYILIFRPGRR